MALDLQEAIKISMQLKRAGFCVTARGFFDLDVEEVALLMMIACNENDKARQEELNKYYKELKDGC